MFGVGGPALPPFFVGTPPTLSSPKRRAYPRDRSESCARRGSRQPAGTQVGHQFAALAVTQRKRRGKGLTRTEWSCIAGAPQLSL